MKRLTPRLAARLLLALTLALAGSLGVAGVSAQPPRSDATREGRSAAAAKQTPELQLQAGVHITGRVSRIFVTNTWVNFRLADDSCVTGTGYYRFQITNDHRKIWAAMLLTSARSGSDIVVWIVQSQCPAAHENIEVGYLYQDF